MSASPAAPAVRNPSLDLPAELWAKDLRQAAQDRRPWLWHGILAPGAVTLLTSLWKSGKTTLVSVLLARLRAGGTLAGLPLAAGKAVVVSEESPLQWYDRSQKLDFGDHVCWLCRPFRGKPSPDEWLALLDRLAELHARHNLDLAVIDPLATFLPGRDESNAGAMLQALTALQRLTTRGMSVLLLHHPRKQDSPAGMAARGSGALSGFVDVLLEMDWYSRANPDDRRRQLRAFSRFVETPPHVVIELNAEGTDYAALDDFHEEEFTQSWQRLRAVLEDANGKLTRKEILAQWPADWDKPDPKTVWAWLQRAVGQGLVCREGDGRKSSPFRYWLPGMEAKWKTAFGFLDDLPELEPLPPLSPERLMEFADRAKRILDLREQRKREKKKGG